MLTFDHSVKVNGKWFKAGEPVDFPVLKPTYTEKPVEADAKETAQAQEKVEKPTPAPAKRSYTKRK